tara:strand:+ start:427 stop:1029 length:603 start_codon:yes stop_codon:yes gene_type:complete
VPIALLVCVQSLVTDWLRPLGATPPLLATGLVLFGILESRHFHPQERVWQETLNRARIFATVNFGLAPFVFFWSRFPHDDYYRSIMVMMIVSTVLFIYHLNLCLRYLARMLPDQTLREDTELFTGMNILLIVVLLVSIAVYRFLQEIETLPIFVIYILELIEESGRWSAIFLVLLPIAMTMSLIWKIKETVMSGIFGGVR